jgi:hypothetical protein
MSPREPMNPPVRAVIDDWRMNDPVLTLTGT